MLYRWLLLLLITVSCEDVRHDKNQLAGEQSSYLQDSADSEIWWHPWGPPPLQRATAEDRLIFLSIGYSSCFACEKMEKQVYADPEVIQTLNQNFVTIKVDREDRPDLDAHFLNMQSLIMGFGAWPINMILTPDLKPVFATTLLDKKRFLKILKTSAKTWDTEKPKILQGTTRYQVQSAVQPSTVDFVSQDRAIIDDFYARYTHRFDPLYGGKSTGRNFNTKFPVNDEMRLLLRHHLHSGDQQPLKMVHKTMTSIAKSALFDQVAGGFHRYSTSRDWNTPNFEKMLYDQASFLHAYIDIYEIKKTGLYKSVIEKTVTFLTKTMQGPRGGFYSSIAGSLEGKEGYYYTWNPQEIQKALSKEEFQIFNEFYSFSGARRKWENQRSLRRKTTFVKSSLGPLQEKLLQVRNQKGQPAVDQKIITSQSAYVVSALSRLYRVWPSDDFYQLIKKNMDFLLNQHQTLSGDFYRRSVRGHVAEPAVLDDYAYLIDALIQFYQTKFDESYLALAQRLQQDQIRLFWNKERSLFEFSQSHRDFLEEQYLFTDQVRPSGLAMSFRNLHRLARFFINIDYETMANQMLESYPDQLKSDPLMFSSLLLGLDFELSKPRVMIVAGLKKQCEDFSREGLSGLRPYVLFSCQSGSSKLPLNKGKKKAQEGPRFYVCDTRSCQEPTTDYQKALTYLN